MMASIFRNKKTWISTTAITLVFAGLYFGFRNLPAVQCEALHYEVTRTTEQGVEMCADGPAGLLDLAAIKFPGSLEFHTGQTVQAGEPYHGVISILGPGGSRLLPHELAITHTERIHLLVIHENLDEYFHLHPQPISGSGEWEFSFTPQSAGTFDVYAEMVPVRTRKQLIVHQNIEVAKGVNQPETVPVESNDQSDYEVDWRFHTDTLRSRQSVDFQISIRRRDGEPVELEKVMDAYSHVVAFVPGVRGFAHIHPLEISDQLDPMEPEFQFRFYTGNSGNYRFWAQFQAGSEPIFKSTERKVL